MRQRVQKLLCFFRPHHVQNSSGGPVYNGWVNSIIWFLSSFQYGDAGIHTAVRHDHVHLLPYLLGPSFQSVLLPTRNGSHKEVEHVNLQNEVSTIKGTIEHLFRKHELSIERTTQGGYTT